MSLGSGRALRLAELVSQRRILRIEARKWDSDSTVPLAFKQQTGLQQPDVPRQWGKNCLHLIHTAYAYLAEQSR